MICEGIKWDDIFTFWLAFGGTLVIVAGVIVLTIWALRTLFDRP